jgi:hypothetical protein
MKTDNPVLILMNEEQLARVRNKLYLMGERRVYEALLDPSSYTKGGRLKKYPAAKSAGLNILQWTIVMDTLREEMSEYMS